MVAGRFLNQPDLEERRKVAVIGTSVRDLLFEAEENPDGERIEMSGVYFKVVGGLKSMQSGERGEREAQTVFVPFTTFQQAFNFGNRVGWLAVTSRSEFAASEVEEKVLELLRQRHKVAPDDRRGFGHFNLEEEDQKIKNLFLAIEVLVWV